MPPRTARKPTLENTLPPILSLLDATPPDAYGAHQKALTTTARLAQHDNAPLAIEVLFSVGRQMLKLGETASGVELGVRMLDIMGESDVKVDDKSRASVTQLIALTPPAGPWRKKLVDAAVKWSIHGGECPTGDPTLQQYIGELYYKDRQFLPAEQHLLASGKRDAAVLLATVMFEWCDKGLQPPGAYGVRGTLPFLAQSPPNILAAQSFLTAFIALLQSPSSSASSLFIGTTPGASSTDAPLQLSTDPTLNFLQLAIPTVQRAPAPGTSAVQARGMDGGIARDWQQLVARYRRVGGSDGVLANKDVAEAIDHISTAVFLVPQRGGGNDMLSSLMGSLFGGGGGGQPAIGAR